MAAATAALAATGKLPHADGAMKLNPKTKHYEWGGPVGALFMMLTIPATIVILNALCTPSTCAIDLSTPAQILPLTYASLDRAWPQVPEAIGVYLAWIVLHCVLYVLPFGERREGQPLRTGERLTYNLNAFQVMILSYILAFGGHYAKWFDLGVLARDFESYAVASIIISVTMSILLYIVSFRSKNVLLALGGNSGNLFYDMWVGRELNPRIGSLDLKFMFELRPGLIGWTLLCWAFVVEVYQTTGVAPWNIALISAFQTMYVMDGLWFEAGNMTMMDIVHDGFGLMLCAGDLAWVPFLYTLQARYLYLHPTEVSELYLGVCVVLHVVGYTLFRRANSVKDQFRRDPKHPSVQGLKVMKTSAGKSLIISGVWGICRHPNYVGDWLMTVSWSMLTGFASPLPYFQPIYFAILLMHRQLRDEEQMKIKYGDEDWKAFCKAVPYRLIPKIY